MSKQLPCPSFNQTPDTTQHFVNIAFVHVLIRRETGIGQCMLQNEQTTSTTKRDLIAVSETLLDDIGHCKVRTGQSVIPRWTFAPCTSLCWPRAQPESCQADSQRKITKCTVSVEII